MLDFKNNTEVGVMTECGFRPPERGFVKHQISGKYFEAFVQVDGKIRVLKKDKNGVVEWACTFDDKVSFGNWAKENT